MANESLIDEKLNEKMESTRNIITEALQLRAKNKIKVRQPLAELIITNYETQVDFIEIMKEEVNVKDVVVKAGVEKKVELNTVLTEELRLEGQAREIIRFIQEMRKEAGYEVDNRIILGYSGMQAVFDKFSSLIQKEVLATEIVPAAVDGFDLQKEFLIDGNAIIINIKKEG
jgi:isoleucyl-tRNA synthetase